MRPLSTNINQDCFLVKIAGVCLFPKIFINKFWEEKENIHHCEIVYEALVFLIDKTIDDKMM